MKTHCLQHKDLVIAWVRIILALGTNHLNFGYESSEYETSVGTKRPVSAKNKLELWGYIKSNHTLASRTMYLNFVNLLACI